MFSKNGDQLMTAHQDLTVRLWDAEYGTPLGQVRTGANVKMADVSPDGQRIVTVSDCPADCVELWNAETGVRVATLPVDLSEEIVPHVGIMLTEIEKAVFSPDGIVLMTVDNAGRVQCGRDDGGMANDHPRPKISVHHGFQSR